MFPRGKLRAALQGENQTTEQQEEITKKTESGWEVSEERSEGGGLMNYGELIVYSSLWGGSSVGAKVRNSEADKLHGLEYVKRSEKCL